jgi:hypothetical protein
MVKISSVSNSSEASFIDGQSQEWTITLIAPDVRLSFAASKAALMFASG